MNKRHAQWLSDELPLLVNAGVLPPETAERLRQYYGLRELPARRPLGLIVCGVLGSLLIGLGIILLLAHNWDFLSRPVRVVISLTPLVIGQALTAWTITKRPNSIAWREGGTSFLIAALGAAISLVSQTYHIPGDLSNFILVWMLLSLPLAYLANAMLPAVFYWIGITAWAGCMAVDGRVLAQGPLDLIVWACWPGALHATTLWYLLFMVLGLPYWWRAILETPHNVRTALMSWVLGLCACVGLGFLLSYHGETGLWTIAYAGLFALFCFAGEATIAGERALGAYPFLTVGRIGTVILALVLSYADVWPRPHYDLWYYFSRYQDTELANYVLAFGLAGAGLAGTVLAFTRQLEQRWYMLNAGLAVASFAGVRLWIMPDMPVLIFNLYLLFLGVILLSEGVRLANLVKLNGGLAVLSLWITARFFDTDLSFALRGLVFIILGAAFLLTNVVILKRRRAAP